MGCFAALARRIATTSYRFQAGRLGVRYLGIMEKHGIALFQDPVTGSSFAIKEGESVLSGVRRVRSRFGMAW